MISKDILLVLPIERDTSFSIGGQIIITNNEQGNYSFGEVHESGDPTIPVKSIVGWCRQLQSLEIGDKTYLFIHSQDLLRTFESKKEFKSWLKAKK